MKQHDYYFWKKFFSLKEIKDLNKIAKLHPVLNFKDSPASAEAKNGLKNLNNVTAVRWEHIKKNLKDLNDKVVITNQERYKFSIDDNLDTNNVLFNVYKKGSFYEWHKDGSNNPYYDYKFTVLINSSEKKYKGGSFQIFTTGGEYTAPEFNSVGDVIMFKSDIVHRVLPVEEGTRNSISFFVTGNKFV